MNNIHNKLKKMPKKLQRDGIRKAIDPEAKSIKSSFKQLTPVGGRKHKNKYRKRKGSGFLKNSFSVRNSGRGTVAGRKVVNRAPGYYVFMSPNSTGRKAGSKVVAGRKYSWGAVDGQKKYRRFWKARQRKVTNKVIVALGASMHSI